MSENEILVYHLYKTTISQVKPERKCILQPIPEDLIIQPGTYTFGNKSFKMEKEGLYRLFEIKKSHIQRIVYKKDIWALISALCWIHSHGSRDQYKKYEEIIEVAKSTKVVMTCGYYSHFVCNLLKNYGILSRVVSMGTLLVPNRWNDGHTAIEIKINKKWVLCDIDQHHIYTYRNKKLSLVELVKQVKKDNYVIKKIANSYNLAVSDFHHPKEDNNYDYGLLCETVFGGMPDERMKTWRKEFLNRVCMIPYIAEENTVYASAPDEKTLQKARRRYPSFQFLQWNEFIRKFYR